MAMAAYFVACKVEEYLRPLDHITKEGWKRYVQYNADLDEGQKAVEFGAFEGETGSTVRPTRCPGLLLREMFLSGVTLCGLCGAASSSGRRLPRAHLLRAPPRSWPCAPGWRTPT